MRDAVRCNAGRVRTGMTARRWCRWHCRGLWCMTLGRRWRCTMYSSAALP